MTKVFIGGSRRVSRFNVDVKQRLDRIVDGGLPVLVGDANGADKAVQDYFRSKHYSHVEVFCSGGCRNNLGDWPMHVVKVTQKRGTFAFYAAKDREMANAANVGFMLWDGESVGTLMNVYRLIERRKKVVVYVVPEKRFVDVKTEGDWSDFLNCCRAELRERIEREVVAERGDAGAPSQANLL